MRRFVGLLIVPAIPTLTFGQNRPASDPRALAFVAQSIAALTGGNSISDVTLTGQYHLERFRERCKALVSGIQQWFAPSVFAVKK